MKTYLKVVNALNKVFENLVVAVLTLLALVVFLQIVTRSLHISVAFLEEAARYTMIYLCFLGAAVCCRRGSLIKVDVVHDLLPPKAARALEEAVNLVSAVFLCFALYSCCKYLPLGFNSDASSMKGIKMFWFYLSMPLGLGMMLLNLVANTYERWKGEEKE